MNDTLPQKPKRFRYILLGFLGGPLLLFLFLLLFGLFFFDGEQDMDFTGFNPKENRIAVMTVEGVITGSDETVEMIDELIDDPSVRGLLLRVNSPGGAVAPSQEIYSELKRFTDAGKKLVVSMGSVAASGGYYISVPADVIYANPGTITGSIGVIANFTSFGSVLDKFGIETSTIKSGKLKDVGSPFRPMTAAEKKFLQKMIDNVYEQFLDTVSVNRLIDKNILRGIADGRILSGEQALQAKLVDKLGSISDAKKEIMALIGVDDKKLFFKKEKKRNLIEKYLGEGAESVLPFDPSALRNTAFLEYRLAY